MLGVLRRAAALWIDSLAVYGLSLVALWIGERLGVRCTLELVYVLLAAAYGAMLVGTWGQTLGQAVVGLRVVRTDGSTVGRGRAVAREVGAKWGAHVIGPIIVLRLVLGDAWVPTVYDALALLAIAIPVLLYALLATRPLHDRLTGTRVIRSGHVELRSGRAIVALVASAGTAVAIEVSAFVAHGFVPSKLAMYHRTGSIDAYVEFLETQRTTPVDYVLSLFERFDVVVLCERMHPEATQWDFVFDLVSDPRFIDGVGNVFTEYGQRDEQPVLDQLMSEDAQADDEVERRVIHLMRNLNDWAVWVNTNFYRYLHRLYRLNQKLQSERRIHHYFADISTRWETLTPANRAAYEATLMQRDRLMAELVVARIRELQAAGRRSKALVIMNYRHAFGPARDRSGAPIDHTAAYLLESLPGKVGNVLINGMIPIALPDNRVGGVPIARGMWDDAFDEIGSPSRGFDFASSPFGADRFDLFPYVPWYRGHYRYQDLFTGFVFVNPLAAQYLETGIPGYFDGHLEEALRRASMTGEDADELRGLARAASFQRETLPLFATQSWLAVLQLGVLGAALPLALAIWLVRRRRGASRLS